VTTQADEPTIKRRRRESSPGRPRAFWARDKTWEQALAACHERGRSLSSELHRALEVLARGGTIPDP
jgi:hypothetical protein